MRASHIIIKRNKGSAYKMRSLSNQVTSSCLSFTSPNRKKTSYFIKRLIVLFEMFANIERIKLLISSPFYGNEGNKDLAREKETKKDRESMECGYFKRNPPYVLKKVS